MSITLMRTAEVFQTKKIVLIENKHSRTIMAIIKNCKIQHESHISHESHAPIFDNTSCLSELMLIFHKSVYLLKKLNSKNV